MSGYEVHPRFKAEREPERPRFGMRRRSKKREAAERDLRAAHALVYLRSRGRCEAAGRLEHACTELATEYHHVLPRSRGGAHTLENLVHLCAEAHRRVHAEPLAARAEGLLA